MDNKQKHFRNETTKLPAKYRLQIGAKILTWMLQDWAQRSFDSLGESLVAPFRNPTWPVAAALLLLSAVLALAMVANPAGPERSAKVFLDVTWVSIAVVAFAYLFVGLRNAWKWVGGSALHMIVVFMVYAVIGLGIFHGLTTIAPWAALVVVWLMAYLMLLANWLGAHLLLALVRKRVEL